MGNHSNEYLVEKLQNLANQLANETSSREDLTESTNAFFLIVIGIIIFFMQGGFAFLEAGAVRTKNTVNILIKNMLDALIGGVAYWMIGFALAYGEGGNPFCGGSEFFSYNLDLSRYPYWFFQFVFAATTATIVSGAIAERCHFNAYFAYSIFITGWVYPPVSHWAWDETGWLVKMGYKDFAGSGVVHLVGGTCSLVGCYLMGARKGRFTKQGKPINMPGHSIPLAALGGFILIFGFLAFNGGSLGAIARKGESDIVALAIVNTILGACGGGIVVLFVNKLALGGSWSYLMTLNGALTGMVVQCGGCNVYQPWAALLTGCFGGGAYLGAHFLMLKFQLDDPLDAVAVHGAGGILGVLMVPFFAYDYSDVGCDEGLCGIFWFGNEVAPWRLLGINIVGLIAIIVWSGGWSAIIFGTLSFFNMLRIDRETEFRGNDLVKHGESAYPAEAWVEIQYNTQGQHKQSMLSNAGAPSTGIPSHMAGTDSNRKQEEYNDAFQMVPTAGKLFKGMSTTFGAASLATAQSMASGSSSGGQVNEAFEDNKNATAT